MQSETRTVDSVVIIPTYNEKENVAAIIEAVFLLPRKFDVLIIDDNSPDGTAAIVKDIQTRHGNRVSAQPISPDSNGRSHRAMNSSSRWMPTSPITPTTL